MKKKSTNKLQLVLLLFILSQGAYAQNWVKSMQEQNKTLDEIRDDFNGEWKNKTIEPGHGYKQFKRWEYLMNTRVDKSGKVMPSNYAQTQLNNYLKARITTALASTQATASWKAVGPLSAKGIENGLGRVQCFAQDPKNNQTYWAGTPCGGLWKSTDAGANWSTNTDQLGSLGVSWILIHPTNTQIMYIATGDADGGHSQSIGILKSTDGGNTWSSSGLSFNLNEYKYIQKMLFHPTNPDIIYAIGTDGIYKSINAGTNWTLIYNAARIFDLEFKPNNPAVIYATGYNKFLKSADGGGSWLELTNNLPASNEKTLIAVSAAAPDQVYFLTTLNNTFEGIYKSDNSGTTFTKLNTHVSVGGQTWWDLVFEINPTDINKLYAGGVSMSESNDGGLSWNYSYNIHADHHNMYFYGNNLFICNDGGLYRSGNGGKDWTLLHNGMAISQFYRISPFAYDPSFMLGGTQDNGTFRLKSNSWKQLMGADGMDNTIAQDNPDVFWVSIQNGPIYKTTDGGNTFNYVNGNINEPGAWVTPFEINPNYHDSIISGFNNVWISNQGGNTWRALSNFDGAGYIDKLLINWKNPSVIYASRSGELWKTTDGGNTWANISSNIEKPNSYNISRATAIDPNNSNRLWVATSYYSGAGKKVFFSQDGGKTFTNISGTLPDIPILCMAYAPGSNDGIYLGCESGIFYKDASMSDWILYNQGLPNVRIEDLQVNSQTGKLYAGTYGRGIWESALHPSNNGLPLADFNPAIKAICTGSTVSYTSYSLNSNTYNWSFPGGNPSSSSAANPVVTYSTPGTWDVSLTVNNPNGTHTKTVKGMIVVSYNSVNTFPYMQTFDGLDTAQIYNLGDWTNGTDDQKDWQLRNGKSLFRTAYNPTAFGPTGDHTSGTGNYLLLSSYNDGNKQANLYSPCFNLSNIVRPTLEYYEYVDEIYNNGGSFHIDIQSEGGWIENVLPAETKVGDLWLKKTLDLSAYTGKIIRIRFRGSLSWSAKDYGIDDIRIYSRPDARPDADFTASIKKALLGFTTQFFDQSDNLPTTYSWSFPGGNPSSSSLANPEVTYSNTGVYDVTLTVSNAKGSTSITKKTYIEALGANHLLSNKVVSDCYGRVYDSGGANGNYSNNEQLTFTIAPAGAALVNLRFYDWNMADTDALYVYDGTSVNAPLIGRFGTMWGNSSPEALTATSGALTLRMESDASGNGSGFKIEWNALGGQSCSPGTTVTPPKSNFETYQQIGRAPFYASFNDLSLNNPIGWTWLLPGATEPRKYGQYAGTTYNNPGEYDVSLITVNEGGRDTLTRKKYIRVLDEVPEIGMQSATFNTCRGILYDDGYKFSNYNPNQNHTLVIQPAGANSVSIRFSEFDLEKNADFLRIYNGPSASSPLLGTYTGSVNPGTVTANSGVMTLVFTSNASIEHKGWVASWTSKGGVCTPKGKPDADFLSYNLSPEAGYPVTLFDLSSNLPDSLYWELPGANPSFSRDMNPEVYYQTPGKYTIKLKAYNALGQDEEIKTDYLTVRPTHPPVAAFSSDKTQIYVGDTVTFYDNSQYRPKTWNWTFEGGTPGSSTDQKPQVIYNLAGQYSVKLVVSNAGGKDSVLQLAYISVKDIPPPVADFVASNTVIKSGEQIQFKDVSENKPTTWLWQFDGGTPAVSTEQHPLITYPAPGTYAVSLTATNAGGANTLTRKEYITVIPAAVEINIYNGTVNACSGTLYDDGGPKGNYQNKKTYTLVIQPKGAKSITIDFSEWNLEKRFDFMRLYNGNSTSAPLIGSYSAKSPGKITASSGALTIYFKSDFSINDKGWKATWKAIGGECTPKIPPVAAFSAKRQVIFEGDDLQFTDLSANSPQTWDWDFGGAKPARSSEQHPLVKYPLEGQYPVGLTVSNNYGSDGVGFKNYITVLPIKNETWMRNGTVTDCRGILFDDGGPKENYKDRKSYTLSIQPKGASFVDLNFKEWALEGNYDFLYIYDGKNTAAPLIGVYSNKSPGNITAKSGSITLKFISDNFVNKSGWKAYWYSDGAGCDDVTMRTVNLNESTENTAENSINLYPNPNPGILHVIAEQACTGISIYDITGKLVLNQVLTEKQSTINLGELTDGLYLVKISQGEFTTSRRILLQH